MVRQNIIYSGLKFFNYEDMANIYYTTACCWLWVRHFEAFRILVIRIIRRRSYNIFGRYSMNRRVWKRATISKFRRNFIWVGLYINRSFRRKSLGARMGRGRGTTHSSFTALKGGIIVIRFINMDLYIIRWICFHSYGWTFRIRYGGNIFINTFYNRFMLW